MFKKIWEYIDRKLASVPPASPDAFIANMVLGAREIEPETYPSFEEFLKRLVLPHPVKGLIPYVLYDFQKEVIDLADNNRIALCAHSRQMGITTLSCAYALYLASMVGKQNILVIENTYTMARDACDRARRLADDDLFDRAQRDFLVLKNGSTITFRGMQREFLYGERAFYHDDPYDFVVIDNADFIPDKWTNDFIDFIRRTRTTRFLVTSTFSKTGNGLLTRLWSSDIEAGRISLPWSKHPERGNDWAERFKMDMGVDSFKREFDCEMVTYPDQADTPK